MNDLVLPSNEVTMDSREIAELTGKQHAHVIRDIRKQFKEIKINESKFGSVYLDRKNEKRVCFKLDYEQTMILLTGYSIPLRAKVIKRRKELESKNKPTLPNSFAEALQLAADQAKQIELQNATLTEQAPKVELAEKCLRNDTQMSITDAGKHLQLSQSKIFKIMRDNGYLTSRNLPTQKALNRKVLRVKSGTNNGENWKQAVMDMENIMNFQERHLSVLPSQRELLL